MTLSTLHRRVIVTALFGAISCAFAGAARAEPKAPSEEESADVVFAKAFIGTIYQGDLELDGWTDLGGGLITPPFFIRHYRREADRTYLVLTAKEVAKATKDVPARLVVADALIVSPPQAGAEFIISCVKGKDEMLRYLGVAKGSPDAEWWSDVRKAWEISVETGLIQTTKPKGVRCTNVSD